MSQRMVPLLGALTLGGALVVAQPWAVVPEEEEPSPLFTGPAPWGPPLWFPEGARDELWIIEHLNGDPQHTWGPKVDAHGGILADLDRAEILWARDPDGPRGMASVTKLFSSLALVAHDELDLEREVCVSYEQWPSRPGARSKFETGDCHQGWEYLGAALVASDNRGAFAFPALANNHYFGFLMKMRQVAQDLNLEHVEFGDPAGLQDENRASPRAVLKAVTAVALHPLLSGVASAPSWRIDPERGPRRLVSTNRLLAYEKRFDTLAAKTGYTDTARYCFAAVVQSRETGRRYGAVVLASPHGGTRWRDVMNLLNWAESSS